jgi:hypothetical protein
MNVQKYWTQLLAALGDATGARNIDQFQKKHIAVLSPSAKVETVAAANVITASESGKTFYLALAGGFASTLPAPAAGLKYKFIVAVAPTTAYTIATNDGANLFRGGINELEVDTGDDGPYSAVGDLISFVANIAVVGDWVSVESDGTNWYITGQTNADGGVTIGST